MTWSPDTSPRLPKLDALMRAAERLTVDLVAQEPYCASPSERSLEKTKAMAEAERFDFLPIRDPDGSLTRFVRTAALAEIDSWDELDRIGEPIGVDLLVSESSPLFSLLRRFEEAPLLFVLARDGVAAVVTVFDLNQPAAHQFAFGLALIIEAEVADVIRAELADGPSAETVDDRVIRQLETKPALISKRMLKKWRSKRRKGEQIDILGALGFAQKIDLLERMGLVAELGKRCGDRYGGADESLLSDLRGHVKELRNDIAHERVGLLDHQTTFERMRLTYELAHAFVHKD